MEEIDLFGKKQEEGPAPLADRMRPQSLDEFVGQEHLLRKGKPLRKAIESGEMGSVIFWGPPGSGKTTLARLIAKYTNSYFISFSAVLSGVKEIREVIKVSQYQWRTHQRETILFVDEIHRFNKAQQDAFLPYVEKGIITLIGATTENPSFEVISALLSRCQVYTLNPLSPEEILVILRRALGDKKRGLGGYTAQVENEVLEYLAQMANGDARVALTGIEFATITAPPNKDGQKRVTLKLIQEALQKKVLLYDKSGEEHYNLISALHKSLRGSDPDAALYWLTRMLESGEDPLYIARRMVRFASEDVGNADPRALQVALAAKDAYHFLGSPEGELALAQAAVYLATAPKSNAVDRAFAAVKEDVQRTQAMPVPLHIRNAPTNLMKKLGYGKGYKFPHNFSEHFVAQDYLPENLKGKRYYNPTGSGFEKEIKRRMEYWRRLRKGEKVNPPKKPDSPN